MADVTTSLLQLVLQETGNNPNNWGELLNDTLQRIEYAIASTNSTATTGGTTTLTDDQALKPVQLVTGTLTSNATIQVPDHTRPYIFRNATSGAFTVTVQRAGGGGTVVVPQGKAVSLYSDGTDVKSAADVLDGAIGTAALADGAVTSAKILDGTIATADLADSAVATAKIADSNVTNAKLAFDGGPFSGFRNRIINGDFRIDQRNIGNAATVTAGAALAYVLDRWYCYCTGASVTAQQVGGSSGSAHRFRFTGAASVTGVYLGQRIERASSADMAGGVATLTVRAASSSLTSLNWALYYATTNDAFGTVASPTRTSIASGTFTINSTEARYTAANITIPSGATTGLELVLSGGALLGGQTLTIGDVMLEAGAAATVFERRPFGTELQLCQRYYAKGYEYGIGPGNAGTTTVATVQADSSGVGYVSTSLPVTMRTAPTAVAYNSTTGGTGTWREGSGADVAVSISSTAVALVFTTVGTPLSQIGGTWAATAEL